MMVVAWNGGGEATREYFLKSRTKAFKGLRIVEKNKKK